MFHFLCQVLRDRVPSPLTQLSRFKSHHWHLLSGALGEALLAVSEMKAPQLEAMQHWLRVCGYMRQKITNPGCRPMRHEFVCKTISRCEARLPLYVCTSMRHALLHFYDIGGWAESVATPSLQKLVFRHALITFCLAEGAFAATIYLNATLSCGACLETYDEIGSSTRVT
jgi:hypothetical protein